MLNRLSPQFCFSFTMFIGSLREISRNEERMACTFALAGLVVSWVGWAASVGIRTSPHRNSRFRLVAVFVALVPSLAFGQVVNWGDYQDSNQTIYLYFNSVGTDGVAETLTSGAVEIYEDGSTTQITSAETLTASFDSIVGFNQLAVDLNDAGFETGKTYTAILTAGTIDSVSVTGRVVGVFSVGRYASATNIIDDLLDRALSAVNGPPGATPTVGEGIAWLVWISQAKSTTTSVLRTWFADDGSTPISEEILSDAAGTMTKGEAAAP